MPTRRRIRPFIRKTTGGGGGGPTPGGTINWGPSFGQSLGDDDSTLNANAAINLDAIGLIGNTTATGTVTMPALAIEGGTTAAGTVTMPELGISGGTTAAGQLRGNLGLSGMISAEDTYLNQAAPSTNYGSVDRVFGKTSAAVGNDATVGYIAWDLTWVPLTGTINNASLHIRSSTSNPLGENGNFEIRTSVAKPFTESTATWASNEPINGTLTETISRPLTTSNSAITLTLGAATLASARGRWLWIRIPGTSPLGLQTITVLSKEHSSSSFRPYLIINVDL